MKLKIYLVLGLIIPLMLPVLALSQEAQTEPETQWLWGEVVSVDAQNRNLLVKYLDFETDQEKQVAINVDDKTTYENVKSLEDIKPEDNVSIDYIISSDANNVAKNITVEKPETAAEVIPQENIQQ